MQIKYLYHHCRDIQGVRHGEITGNSDHAEFFLRHYQKLQKAVGFYPLFLAVGCHSADIYNTGYQNQWRVDLGNSRRHKGDFPNYVLFSFQDVNGVFTDYEEWCMSLNRFCDAYPEKMFRPSWTKEQWLKRAVNKPYVVQMVAPVLDLRTASEIWVRNKSTKDSLINMGFAPNIIKCMRVTMDGRIYSL